MNAAQKSELKRNVAGQFGPLSDIFNPTEIPLNVAKHAATALRKLLTGDGTALNQFEAEFSTHQILESILLIRRIIDHPHPQNRAIGCTSVYTIYTADNREVDVRLLIDGIDEVYNFVYWSESNGQRNQRREEIGLLGLTARQWENDKPITKKDLLEELKVLINESYLNYLESQNEEQESKSFQLEATLRHPQPDFSPAQITCLLTGKIFHTPVILINNEGQCSGIIEKERALSILDACNPYSQPECPITRKPLVGFIVCKATQAMANQFWEKYQSGNFTQKFLRYEPCPETAKRPDCILFDRVRQHSNQIPDVNRRSSNTIHSLRNQHIRYTHGFREFDNEADLRSITLSELIARLTEHTMDDDIQPNLIITPDSETHRLHHYYPDRDMELVRRHSPTSWQQSVFSFFLNRAEQNSAQMAGNNAARTYPQETSRSNTTTALINPGVSTRSTSPLSSVQQSITEYSRAMRQQRSVSDLLPYTSHLLLSWYRNAENLNLSSINDPQNQANNQNPEAGAVEENEAPTPHSPHMK